MKVVHTKLKHRARCSTWTLWAWWNGSKLSIPTPGRPFPVGKSKLSACKRPKFGTKSDIKHREGAEMVWREKKAERCRPIERARKLPKLICIPGSVGGSVGRMKNNKKERFHQWKSMTFGSGRQGRKNANFFPELLPLWFNPQKGFSLDRGARSECPYKAPPKGSTEY